MHPTPAARVLVKGAAARCCFRVQLLEWRVFTMLQLKWCVQSKWCVCFGVRMLVPLQDASARLTKHKF